jgi:SAM-dependent methyltransferase
MMEILDHNRAAWNNEVAKGNQWTMPVTQEEMEAAANGIVKILLTPYKPVPKDWLGDLSCADVLCLASGGGQQGPILAAAGAKVTVFDNSDRQLGQDEVVAKAYNLTIRTVQGNMQDLGAFANEVFDLIVHPVSNCFIDNVLPVWRECSRVLRSGGRLLSGFANPLLYMIDWEEAERSRECRLKFSIPYKDTESLPGLEREKYLQEKIPFEFGHSLTDLIQGQIAAGFHITGFYEDKGENALDFFTEVFIATRAIKEGL